MAPKKDYLPQQMQDAVAAVQNGEKIATAAKRFGVPRITLTNKVTGKSPLECRMGPKTILTDEEEEVLVKWIIALGERRFPATKDILLDTIQQYINTHNRTNPFTANRPGKKWFASFLRRHPEISQRIAENLSASRNDVTQEEIVNWFNEIEDYLVGKGLLEVLNDPNRVFNTDESAFFLSSKPGQVLARRGNKHVYSASGDEKENLTVAITGNAAGILAPPMIVFAYARIPAGIASSVPENWGIGKSESGWMCSDTFYEYITSVFNPWLEEMKISKPVVLFLDGHKSHLTLNLSNYCAKNGIELIALYPNSTHILQPMDIAIFKPLKQCFRKEVAHWKLENKGEKLKKETFAPVFKKALDLLSVDCVKNGFRAAGLHPFGSENIDFSKLRKVNREHNNKKEEKRNEFLKMLESEIIQLFGSGKLYMYNKLYYGHQNVDNIASGEDMNLYQVWKSAKQMTISFHQSNEPCSAALNPSWRSVSEQELYYENEDGFDQALLALANVTVQLDENIISPVTETTSTKSTNTNENNIRDESPPLREPVVSETVNFAPQTRPIGISPISPTIQDPYDELDYTLDTNLSKKTSPQKDDISNALSVCETSNTKETNLIENRIRDESFLCEPIVSEATVNLVLQSRPVSISPISSTIQESYDLLENALDSNLNKKTSQQKDDISDSLGVKVPSPFKKCLFWPDNLHVSGKKKLRHKEKIPSVATSSAWREYHEKKEAEKKRVLEDKELKAKQRIEKRKLKEQQTTDKQIKRMKKSHTCADTESININIPDGESSKTQINPESDSNACEEIINDKNIPTKDNQNAHCRKRRKNENTENEMEKSTKTGKLYELYNKKNNFKIGCFVIAKYEGEYFPGVIENKDNRNGSYQISTMVLSKGNTFKWPESKDSIWYKKMNIIEIIKAPMKHNNRGYFKIPEMNKFLPIIIP